MFDFSTPPTTLEPTKSENFLMPAWPSSSTESLAVLCLDDEAHSLNEIPNICSRDKKHHLLRPLSKWSPSNPNLGEFNKVRIQSVFKSMRLKLRASMMAKTPPPAYNKVMDSSIEIRETKVSPSNTRKSESIGSCCSTWGPSDSSIMISPVETMCESSAENRSETWEENTDNSLEMKPLERLSSTESECETAVIEWAERVPISHSHICEIFLRNGETLYKTSN